MNRKEFYNSLSEEMKVRIKACKSEEEMLKVLSEEKIELDPELLETVSGGRDGHSGGCTCLEAMREGQCRVKDC